MANISGNLDRTIRHAMHDNAAYVELAGLLNKLKAITDGTGGITLYVNNLDATSLRILNGDGTPVLSIAKGDVSADASVYFTSLETSNPGDTGALWVNNNVLTLS